MDAIDRRHIDTEARRLMAKYHGSAALKALYRATGPDHFYALVSERIIHLETEEAGQ